MIAVRPSDDQAGDPGRRLVVERDDGLWRIVDETVLPERVYRTDAHHRVVHADVTLTDESIAWAVSVVASVQAAARGAIEVATARAETETRDAMRLAGMTPGQLRARHARLTAELDGTTHDVMHRSVVLDRLALLEREAAIKNANATAAADALEQARARIAELEVQLQAATGARRCEV